LFVRLGCCYDEKKKKILKLRVSKKPRQTGVKPGNRTTEEKGDPRPGGVHCNIGEGRTRSRKHGTEAERVVD